MEIIDVEQKDIHGGSIRIFISNKGNYQVQESVINVLSLEKEGQLRDKKALLSFGEKVAE